MKFADDEETTGVQTSETIPARGELRWSSQQERVFEWIRTGQGNATVISVAGSGKTTTIEHAVSMVGGYVSVVAYNKKIADEIQRRIPKQDGQMVSVGTMHSFGLRNWRKVAPGCKVEGPLKDNCDPRFQNAGYFKFDRIIDILSGAETLNPQWKDEIGDIAATGFEYKYRSFTRKLMGLAKQYGVGPLEDVDGDIWNFLIDRFDLEDDLQDTIGEFQDGGRASMVTQGITFTKRALRVSNALSHEVVDYDDMIYMALSTECKVFKVDWLFADETQDMNPTRIALMRKMLKGYGRMVAVGDPKQSIYAWTGAGDDAIHKINATFGCVELPLTVSFRCPKAIVAEAQKFVSHIQAADSAPEGEVLSLDEETFLSYDEFRVDDVILCRYNAPLVEHAYRLIKRGIACYVEGRDIGNNLIELAIRWKIVKLSAMKDKLNEYRRREVAKLMAHGRESQADSLNDRVETLITIIDGLPEGCTTNDLRTRISTLFQDSDGNRRKCLTLSSVHKSKGREWPRVFMLGRNIFMPSRFARQDWQKEQENNLMYVMATRAKETLVDVLLERRARG